MDMNECVTNHRAQRASPKAEVATEASNRVRNHGLLAFITFALNIPFSIIHLCNLIFMMDLRLLDSWQLAVCSAHNGRSVRKA